MPCVDCPVKPTELLRILILGRRGRSPGFVSDAPTLPGRPWDTTESRDLLEAAELSGSKYSSAGPSDAAGVAGPGWLVEKVDSEEARLRSDGA